MVRNFSIPFASKPCYPVFISSVRTQTHSLPVFSSAGLLSKASGVVRLLMKLSELLILDFLLKAALKELVDEFPWWNFTMTPNLTVLVHVYIIAMFVRFDVTG